MLQHPGDSSRSIWEASARAVRWRGARRPVAALLRFTLGRSTRRPTHLSRRWRLCRGRGKPAPVEALVESDASIPTRLLPSTSEPR